MSWVNLTSGSLLWRKSLNFSEQVRKELEQKMDEARKALEVKDKEIQDLKEKLR